jgi:hypothetical protein
MSFGSMRMALLMCAFALMPAASRAQPTNEVASLNPTVAPKPSNSTLDVPIRDIAATSSGRAILDKDFPGLRTNSMYGFAKTMTLNQIAGMSHGRITPDMLAQARTDLAALPARPVAIVHQTNVEDLSPAPTGSQASLTASYPK